MLLKAEFGNPTYPFERLGFDGRKFYAMQYAPGARSPFAQFLMSHDAIFSEGLIGGTLSSAWPFLNLSPGVIRSYSTVAQRNQRAQSAQSEVRPEARWGVEDHVVF